MRRYRGSKIHATPGREIGATSRSRRDFILSPGEIWAPQGKELSLQTGRCSLSVRYQISLDFCSYPIAHIAATAIWFSDAKLPRDDLAVRSAPHPAHYRWPESQDNNDPNEKNEAYDQLNRAKIRSVTSHKPAGDAARYHQHDSGDISEHFSLLSRVKRRRSVWLAIHMWRQRPTPGCASVSTSSIAAHLAHHFSQSLSDRGH